ncbi:MAG: adenylosuccinate lyase [Pyrinomonadaceae bacterium]|jgi:adenylosuccinate lyase|nr:adenylosuccinate lyase [Pyrinomonadaceae bacterium]
MIERYTLPEMGALWTEQSKFQKWLDVEIAVCEVHAEMGTIPRDALAQIKTRAKFSVARINEIEKTTNHDVIAFTTNLAENIGDAARFVHYGLTSSDVVDTANALLLRDACDLLLGKVAAFQEVLKRRAFEFRQTPQIGRTHGIHAEPTSFGLTLALWFAEMRRHQERLMRARANVAVGKISGAVGTFALLDPSVEEKVCARLGLAAAPVSTQIIQRDRYAEYLCTLAIIASSLDKFALNVRHWQRTEVHEAQERFTAGQKGSSAMPHKRNPIISERICGIARIVRANSLVGLENVALWHERDISHSSAERVVLPDSSIALDYILHKATSLIDGLVVYPERMLKNLQLTHGLIFSGQLLLALTQKGVSRETAYEWVQRNAMKVWETEQDFQDLLRQDADITGQLSSDELAGVFKFETYLRNVDEIFARVFGESTFGS